MLKQKTIRNFAQKLSDKLITQTSMAAIPIWLDTSAIRLTPPTPHYTVIHPIELCGSLG